MNIVFILRLLLILPIIYRDVLLIFRSLSVPIINMKSSFHSSLQPCTSERSVILNGQAVNIRSDVQLEQLPNDAPQHIGAPLIENYYCQQRGGELVKVTLVRVGREILRMTDRITPKPEPSTEEDDRTKYSSNSSQQEVEPQKQRKLRKGNLSKCAKALLTAFQEWIMVNEPESLKFIMAIKEEYSAQLQLVNFLAFNSIMRQLFLAFTDQFFCKNSQIRLVKLATVWTRRCLMAREEQRMKEEYIQEVLQKM